MTDTTIPDPMLEPQKPSTVTICGAEFTLQPFTEAEADVWAEISDKYDLGRLNKKQIVVAQQMQQLTGARVRDQETVIETIERRLADLRAPDPEKWDQAKIDKLVDRLEEEYGKLLKLRAGEADVVADRSMEVANELEELAATQHEAGLEYAWRMKGHGAPFEKWLREADGDDYKAVEQLIKAGVTPFINRALRRAHSHGRGTSDASKR